MVWKLMIRLGFGAGIFAAIAIVVVVAPIRPAHAYIDAGTGGMLLQLLLGGVAGGLVIIKLYWHRLRETVDRVLGRSTPENLDSD